MSKDLEAFVAAQDHFELVSIADKAKVRRTCTVYVEHWLRFSLRPLLPLAQVRCTLTGHEMLPELEICRLYLGGKAYKRALRRRGAPPPPLAPNRRGAALTSGCGWRAELEAFDFAQYEPHIVPHRTDPFLLYCACAAPPLPPRRPSAAERRCPAGGRR